MYNKSVFMKYKEITKEDVIKKFKKARDAKRAHLEEMERRMRVAYKLRTGEEASTFSCI